MVGAALILPGGAARGAYEAGVIEGLRLVAGVSDGEALPGVNVVAGTSIGAINAWFVATAQYTLLQQLWKTVPSHRLFRVKRRYAATVNPRSDIFNRTLQAAQLSRDLVSSVTGVLDSFPIIDWLTRNIDPSVPVVTPYLITLTNLDERRAEVFYRMNEQPSREAALEADARLRSTFAGSVLMRRIEDRHLASALAASSAIPMLLDPVTIPFADGARTYIDGGIADSAPLDVARSLSRRIHVIFVHPVHSTRLCPANAAAVGSVAFGIASSRMFEAALRVAYLETRVSRSLRRSRTTVEQRKLLAQTFDVDLFVIRPDEELPLECGGFDDAEGIVRVYELGRTAGLAGFHEYRPVDGTTSTGA
jgi:predicted acylesterase/phospholipase RssA